MESASPVVNASATLVQRRRELLAVRSSSAPTPPYAKARDYEIASGSSFTSADVKNGTSAWS